MVDKCQEQYQARATREKIILEEKSGPGTNWEVLVEQESGTGMEVLFSKVVEVLAGGRGSVCWEVATAKASMLLPRHRSFLRRKINDVLFQSSMSSVVGTIARQVLNEELLS